MMLVGIHQIAQNAQSLKKTNLLMECQLAKVVDVNILEI